MRQHVNPLSSFFQRSLSLPNVDEMFEDCSLPIHLDIGSARGKFLVELASKNIDWNHLGVEIRNPLVISSERDRIGKGLKNVKFSFCNANVSLESWLLTLKYGQLKRVSIQFPDPWFKRRHFKRRVLQPKLVVSLANSFQVGSELFIQSDIYEVIHSMITTIEDSKYFERQAIDDSIWLKVNPYNASTEREIYAIQNELPIYRALFLRNSFRFNQP